MNLTGHIYAFTQCEKKLTKVICPEPWKGGAGPSKPGPGGKDSHGRKINENKMLGSKRWQPYGAGSKCSICKSTMHQEGKYCQKCAYSKVGQGFCSSAG